MDERQLVQVEHELGRCAAVVRDGERPGQVRQAAEVDQLERRTVVDVDTPSQIAQLGQTTQRAQQGSERSMAQPALSLKSAWPRMRRTK